MKRIVLLVCGALLSFAVEARDVAELFQSYSGMEGVAVVTLNRKTFNLMKPFLGLGKEMKRLFDSLNLKQMDMLRIDGKSSVDKSRAAGELSGMCTDSVYVSVRDFSDADIDENSDFLFRREGDRIVEVVIYALNDDGLVAMKIACDAEAEKVREALSK